MKQLIYKTLSLIFPLIFIINSFGQEIGSDKVILENNFANKFDPEFSKSGNEFYFVSNKTGKFKLYFAKKNNVGEWGEAVSIENINNFKEGEANIRYPSLNYDGSILYYCADHSRDSSDVTLVKGVRDEDKYSHGQMLALSVDIYYSVKEADGWSEPINIGKPINSTLYDGQPSISVDNKSLYFVRYSTEAVIDNPNCKSIYLSEKDKDGNWTKPVKLPVPVNVGCEQAPKIAIDNKTLYFSSDREGGLGGFDIYKTRLIAKNVWLPAESIDGLNTEFNDFSLSTSFNSEKAFFSIEKEFKTDLSGNIYEKDIPKQFLLGKVLQLKGVVKDLISKKPIASNILINDPYTSRQLFSIKNSKETGEYEFYLPRGGEYQIDFQKENYSHYFLNISTEKLRRNLKQTENVNLYRNISLLLNIVDKEIFKPIESKIKIFDADSLIVQTEIIKEKTGRYNISLPIGEKYRIAISANYYDPTFFDFDLTGIVQFDEFENDIELKSNKIEFDLNISDEGSQFGEPVEVIVTNLETNEVTKMMVTPNSEGNYKIHLRDGDKYNVSVSPKGYSFYNTTVDLKKKRKTKKVEKKIVVKLQKLEKDAKLTLKNITFEVNSADLNTESFDELNRVVKLMKDNPEIKIEISAHTDNTGSNVYNLRLSKRRAKSVMLYLLEENIPSLRLISKGYGEAKPLYPNDTDENKAKNRRVELKVVKS